MLNALLTWVRSDSPKQPLNASWAAAVIRDEDRLSAFQHLAQQEFACAFRTTQWSLVDPAQPYFMGQLHDADIVVFIHRDHARLDTCDGVAFQASSAGHGSPLELIEALIAAAQELHDR